MKLYDYFRSSAGYRVRIALNLKGIAATRIPVNLLNGEDHSESYHAINPQALVPSLQLSKSLTLTQSLAICEYLEESEPTPALLPTTTTERAWVRGIAHAIACDIHPLNNLRILQYLTGELAHSEEEKLAWYRHWISVGFEGIEAQLLRDRRSGLCCFGDEPTLADICLIPQMHNAQRFNVDLSAFPTLCRINEHCNRLPAFIAAHPEQQSDAN